MSPDFASKVKEVFELAQTLDLAERPAFLDRECAGDEALRAEVEDLLAVGERGSGFLETPAYRLPDSTLAEAVRVEALESLSSGDRVGPYRIVRPLGAGGMGSVWLAEQTEPMRREVALKIIKLGMDTKRVVARFEAERQTLALMSHPGIARVLDAGATDEGRPYFAMEYVPGVPITAWCDQHQTGTGERLRLFVSVCEAVQHAHQKGIVHRDLKPSNILVSEQSGQAEAKVIDFGIAKATGTASDETARLTRPGLTLGTPEYMAPEQLTGRSGDVDTRSDLFSLGVLLYELLTGKLPRNDPQDPRIVRPSARALEQGNTALARSLRGDLDWIALKALEEDRNRRYASASELAADVRRHLSNEPVVASPPSTTYRISKFVRRYRLPVSLGAVAFALLVAGIGGMAWSWNRTREARADANARLDEILRLSDLYELEQLESEAEELYPTRTETVPAMQEWLRRADELAARHPKHAERLSAFRSLAAGSGPPWVFDDPRLAWEHQQLTELVLGLERLASDDPAVSKRADVSRRVALADEIEVRTLIDAAGDWDYAIASIRDPEECPAYGGLEIEPQLGLFPLGPDPESGLWEFLHVETGEMPERGLDGSLLLTEETGLVFVLLPGGTFGMGARTTSGEPWAPVDPMAADDEGPPALVELEPFFLSKYEMTQGQWLRVARRNPSVYSPERYPNDPLATLRLPIENVTWLECDLWLRRLDLCLPTEAQWEYACRAGTTTPWWVGDDPGLLSGVANLGGLERSTLPKDNKHDPLLKDDHQAVADVGSYLANPFGLHDTIGNVWEWCADQKTSYGVAPRAGDGLRVGEGNERIGRGGGFRDSHRLGRSSCRYSALEYNLHPVVGVRPARPLR